MHLQRTTNGAELTRARFGLRMSTHASTTVVAASVAGLAVVALLRWATRLREADGVVCSPLSELILRWRLRRLEARRALRAPPTQPQHVPDWPRVCPRSVDRLVIVADFDRTITSAFVDAAAGVAGSTSHGILESCSVLSPAYRAKAQALLDKYHPIEFSATLSREEKLPIMQEWYRQSHALVTDRRVRTHPLTRRSADPVLALRAASCSRSTSARTRSARRWPTPQPASASGRASQS